jgi:hypothetical protein
VTERIASVSNGLPGQVRNPNQRKRRFGSDQQNAFEPLVEPEKETGTDNVFSVDQCPSSK